MEGNIHSPDDDEEYGEEEEEEAGQYEDDDNGTPGRSAATRGPKDPELMINLPSMITLDHVRSFGFEHRLGFFYGRLGSVWLISDSTAQPMFLADGRIHFNPYMICNMYRGFPKSVYFALLHELAHRHHGHPGNTHVESMENEMQADYTASISAIHYNKMGDGWESVTQFIELLEVMIREGVQSGGSHPTNRFRRERLVAFMGLVGNKARVRVTMKSNSKVPLEEIRPHFSRLRVEDKDLKCKNGVWTINGSGEIPYKEFLDWRRCLATIPLKIREGIDVDVIWVTGPMMVYQNHKNQLRYCDSLGVAGQKIDELKLF